MGEGRARDGRGMGEGELFSQVTAPTGPAPEELEADAHGLRVTPHAFHELSVQLMCAVPNGFWLEYVPWWERLFTQPLELREGGMRPPAGPGLGLQFDWQVLDAWRIA